MAFSAFDTYLMMFGWYRECWSWHYYTLNCCIVLPTAIHNHTTSMFFIQAIPFHETLSPLVVQYLNHTEMWGAQFAFQSSSSISSTREVDS